MMYYLRDRGDKNSLECLASLLHPKYREKTGVLFRHEICFVMGCLGENAICIVDKIIDCAKDITENGIVRHEAVSAYSSIYDDKDFLDDQHDIVKESCIVGLELIDYWHE